MPLSRMMMESNTMAKEMAVRNHLLPGSPRRRTAHNLSSSSLRKSSDASLLHKVPCAALRSLLANLNDVLLTTRLFLLFPAVLLAIAATYLHFGQVWVFVLSLIGLVPLAERLSFLTEQIAFYTGPTVGGLLNATFGNVTEVIIALLALREGKIEVVKCSLLGSILSNLLLVLGTSLFLAGIANLRAHQPYDTKQAHVNTALLMLAVEDDDDDDLVIAQNDEPVLGFSSAMIWLALMTLLTALLSGYVVSTIEAASESWELSVSFISIILLPIVGNAAEHAGAVIFALKNKLDITLGVSLGSATQISMFVVPVSVIVAWTMGIPMDLDFNLLETGSLFLAILVTAFTLQEGESHYLKGLILVLCYAVISVCFFVIRRRSAGGTDGVHHLDGIV
uniref:Vacuolar cation/proton exchanger n=1 Tax=Oryza barthii TaxID=65489 RepID=A0A0D3GBL9_9ORYZ